MVSVYRESFAVTGSGAAVDLVIACTVMLRAASANTAFIIIIITVFD